MTISSQLKRLSYSGNGSTTSFAYSFRILDQASLKVVVQSAAGVDSVKTITTDYTVSGVGSSVGGAVVFVTAPILGETVSIILDPELTQLTDYSTGGAFPAQSHEDALDKQLNLNKRTRDLVDRSIHISDGDSSTPSLTVPSLTLRASKALTFDSSGNVTVTDPATASGTTVTATGTTTARALQERFAEVFNVKDFGATGDGVTDDSVSIQAALTAAKASPPSLVLFPPGTYSVSAQLSIGSVTTLSGYGAKLFLATNANVHVLRGETGATDITILGLAIDGNMANQSGSGGHGISLNGTALSSKRLAVQDCRITNCKETGIFATSCEEVQFTNNIVTGGGGEGIQVTTACQNVMMSGNHVKDTVNAGISFGGDYITIVGNVVENCGSGGGEAITGYGETNDHVTIVGNVCRAHVSSGHGIHVGGSALVISDNLVENARNDGIYVENTNDGLSAIDRVTINGNSVRNCTNGAGMNVVNVRKGAISGNTIDTCAQQGINLVDCQDLAVSGNVISHCTDKGIRMAGVIDSAITGNVIVSGGTHGIQLLDGTAGCLSNVISGNNIKDNTGTGIFFSGAEANNYVHGNSLFGNATSLGTCDPTTNAVSNYVSDNNLESVAAAASVTLPTTGNSIVITDTSGPTTINTIVNSFAGRVVTLMFSNAVATVVGDATGNVYLAGTFTASGTHNDTLTLLSNGTNGWIEVSRSAN